MKVSPQPRVSALLRIFAGTCALFWLVGIAVCGMSRVCNCAGHERTCATHASPVHEQAAVSPHEQGRSQDAEHHKDANMHQHVTATHHDGTVPQGCAGNNGCEDKRCCSTIQAFVQTPSSIALPKLVSQPVLMISILCAAREYALAASPIKSLRQAKPRDRVFTPEVCLGPAFRSLAPPAFV